MRIIQGKKIIEIDKQQFEQKRLGYENIVVDLGTGDGKHVLNWAKANPKDFIIGIDSNAKGLEKSAFRTAKNDIKNAIFVCASVYDLPDEINNFSSLHILMPWGSLLRTLFPLNDEDKNALMKLSQLANDQAEFIFMINLHAWRPPVPEVGNVEEPNPEWVMSSLKEVYKNLGLDIISCGKLDDNEIKDYETTWLKKLKSSRLNVDVLVIRGLFNQFKSMDVQ